jgi:hypothetical protein
MPLAIQIGVAVVVIAVGYLALRRNLASLRRGRWLVWAVGALGLVAGVPLGSMASHQDANLQILGIPVTVVILELRDGRWLDFVGLMTPVGFVLNTLAWAALWQVALATVLFARGRRPGNVAVSDGR